MGIESIVKSDPYSPIHSQRQNQVPGKAFKEEHIKSGGGNDRKQAEVRGHEKEKNQLQLPRFQLDNCRGAPLSCTTEVDQMAGRASRDSFIHIVSE